LIVQVVIGARELDLLEPVIAAGNRRQRDRPATMS
jgi:hypothetical protein